MIEIGTKTAGKPPVVGVRISDPVVPAGTNSGDGTVIMICEGVVPEAVTCTSPTKFEDKLVVNARGVSEVTNTFWDTLVCVPVGMLNAIAEGAVVNVPVLALPTVRVIGIEIVDKPEAARFSSAWYTPVVRFVVFGVTVTVSELLTVEGAGLVVNQFVAPLRYVMVGTYDGIVPVLLDNVTVVAAGGVPPGCENVIELRSAANTAVPVPVPPVTVTGMLLGSKPWPVMLMLPFVVPVANAFGFTSTRSVNGRIGSCEPTTLVTMPGVAEMFTKPEPPPFRVT